MFRYAPHSIAAAVALLFTLGLAGAHAEQDPDPQALLADMQRALIPGIAQFSRVHIAARSDQPGGGSKEWDALVIRQRDAQGPRTAFSLVTPANLKGAGILTAPHPSKQTLGLWLSTSEELRPVEFSPLEADRQFLSTRFNFEDVGLTTRDTQPPLLLGAERIEQLATWKVETRPVVDRYYSRILTWIAADTHLPVKREYYDRADQLWKVIRYHAKQVDGIPTIMAIDLTDLQSRDTANWRVDALAYQHEKLEQKVLSPAGLTDVHKHAFWNTLGEDDATKRAVKD